MLRLGPSFTYLVSVLGVRYDANFAVLHHLCPCHVPTGTVRERCKLVPVPKTAHRVVTDGIRMPYVDPDAMCPFNVLVHGPLMPCRASANGGAHACARPRRDTR